MSAPKMYPSKASPPINPVSGVGGAGVGAAVRRKPATAPDWAYWPASRPVAPWQAVALSLNLDPDSLKHSPHAWMAGPGSGPVLESEGFPDAQIEAAFRKRLALLVAFVSHSSRVPLGELAGMLVAHTLPPKLATMATAPAATASPKETAKFGDGGTAHETLRDRIKPVPRLAAQDAAILEEIRRAGHDPLALPKAPAGKSGVKAVIRKSCLSRTNVFQSKGVFDEAWQRLRGENKIVDHTD